VFLTGKNLLESIDNFKCDDPLVFEPVSILPGGRQGLKILSPCEKKDCHCGQPAMIVAGIFTTASALKIDRLLYSPSDIFCRFLLVRPSYTKN